jgi:hypothetical protein
VKRKAHIFFARRCADSLIRHGGSHQGGENDIELHCGQSRANLRLGARANRVSETDLVSG